ncbi:MAG: hypothetical protein GY820_42530, partial [Gammaproteobacteria bacterium]|nr:hypothetical protein [Gammaproteobacteria bacterium]
MHETRELVQCALLGLVRQWPNRIRSCLMQALPAAWDQLLSTTNKNNTEIIEWIRVQSAKSENTPQNEWEEWVKVAYREQHKGGSVSKPVQKNAPNLSVAPPKCFHCGSTSHKPFSCGFRQQQQQQQQFRNPGPPQPVQNQNWGPSNQNYGNSQSNQSNYAWGSGQSGNAGYGHGGYNNMGYNNTRNTGYSNNSYAQQGYGN